MKRNSASTVYAAGALVWRVKKGELQVLAVHRPRYKDWSWPKGKLDEGESIAECAVREVAEETGRQVELGIPLPSLRYPIAGEKEKHVRYWAARVISDDHPAVAARATFKAASKNEIDKVKWLTVAQARDMITFRDDLRPLQRLVDAYESGRLNTRALVLTRHARATRRRHWKGPELERPITGSGKRRARELQGILAAFGPRRVESSPAQRCVDTVQPFLSASGLTIALHPALTEARHAKKPEAAAKVFARAMSGRKSRVLCAHRPTLPTIVELLRDASDTHTRGALPRKNPYLPAGGVLVAHLTDLDGAPRVVAIETYLLATEA